MKIILKKCTVNYLIAFVVLLCFCSCGSHSYIGKEFKAYSQNHLKLVFINDSVYRFEDGSNETFGYYKKNNSSVFFYDSIQNIYKLDFNYLLSYNKNSNYKVLKIKNPKAVYKKLNVSVLSEGRFDLYTFNSDSILLYNNKVESIAFSYLNSEIPEKVISLSSADDFSKMEIEFPQILNEGGFLLNKESYFIMQDHIIKVTYFKDGKEYKVSLYDSKKSLIKDYKARLRSVKKYGSYPQ